MDMLRRPNVRTLVLAALSLMAFFGTRLATAAVRMRFRDVPLLPTLLTASRWVALLALAGVLVAAARIVLPAALSRAPLGRRLASALPSFLLLVVLAGVGFHFAEIGTLGTQVEAPILGRLTFTQAWLALSALLAMLALPLAVRAAPAAAADATTRRILQWTMLPLLIACGGLVLVLGWVAAGAPPPQAPPGGPGGAGGPGGPGNAPSLFVPMLVGATLTTLLALWATAAATRPLPPQRAAGAKAAKGEADRAPAERDPAGMLAAWAVTAVVAVAVIQLLPVTRDNPPVVTATAWDSPTTADLWDRTCAACHSHDTRWPWYAGVAPGSWLVAGHVHSGREDLNVSRLDEIPDNRRARLPDQLERVITSGRMPPRDFLMLHPEARLTSDEQNQLIQGLKATFAAPSP